MVVENKVWGCRTPLYLLNFIQYGSRGFKAWRNVHSCDGGITPVVDNAKVRRLTLDAGQE